jgi:hypothetical protein
MRLRKNDCIVRKQLVDLLVQLPQYHSTGVRTSLHALDIEISGQILHLVACAHTMEWLFILVQILQYHSMSGQRTLHTHPGESAASCSTSLYDSALILATFLKQLPPKAAPKLVSVAGQVC